MRCLLSSTSRFILFKCKHRKEENHLIKLYVSDDYHANADDADDAADDDDYNDNEEGTLTSFHLLQIELPMESIKRRKKIPQILIKLMTFK